MSTNKKQFKLEEAIIPGIALLFGAAYFLQTTDGPGEVMRWPQIIAVICLLFVVAIGAKFFFASSEEGSTKRTFKVEPKALLILVGPLLYTITMPYLGFALGSFLFLNLMFMILGSKSWVKNILISLFLSGGLYFVMVSLMEMDLPRLNLGFFVL